MRSRCIILFLISIPFFSCQNNEDIYLDIPPGIHQDIHRNIHHDLNQLLQKHSKGAGKSFFILPDSDDFDKIPQDPLNPITQEKVALGKLLLHETATAGNPKLASMKNTYSCASCHHAAAGFAAGVRQGIGECGVGFGSQGEGRVMLEGVNPNIIDVQAVRSPSLLNVAYQKAMLWNGRFGGVETNLGTEAQWQSIPENFEGLHGVEVQAIKGQKVHRLLIDRDFVTAYNYTSLFDAAFPDVPKDKRYAKRQAAFAIAAYERTILANQAPWQRYLKGDATALSDSETRGAIVFFGKAKCYSCHTGPALNDEKFHAFGMGDFSKEGNTMVLPDVDFISEKKGRGGFTKQTKDNYKFKTPTLYNLEDQVFLGHGATFTSVESVIRYKLAGIPQNKEVLRKNLAPEFGNIKLSEAEIIDLTQFVSKSLRDPNLNRYVPERVHSGFCFPNNDSISREDLGCKLTVKNNVN